MFVLTTVAETIRIEPSSFGVPTLSAVHQQIDCRYPNRVVMGVGLCVCRYGPALRCGEGVCVPGDGAAHYEVVFRLVVWRPFVEEVCVGRIVLSTEEGVRVSIGFFEDVFIPAYWMLRPSYFDPDLGLWVWTPSYDDDNEEGNKDDDKPDKDDANDDNDSRFEMELGAQIRFKVKSLHFTQITDTAKGVQATTTTTSSASAAHEAIIAPMMQKAYASKKAKQGRDNHSDSGDNHTAKEPKVAATFYVVGSICEDGLGLTSWWEQGGGEELEDEVEADAAAHRGEEGDSEEGGGYDQEYYQEAEEM